VDRSCDVEEERNILHAIKKNGKANWIGHILLRDCLIQHIIEVRGKDKGDGKTRKKT